MRLSDREAVHAIKARLEPIGRTALSIVYTDKGNSTSALKAAGFWLDGEMYDHPAFAEDTSNVFKREAAHYEALGSHPCILKCMGVELMPDGEEASAVHDRGVIWGDISARHVLVFDSLHIKLCDFAGSNLKDKFPEILCM
ncbi:hypothetical protein IL306_013984 [Fusarium sp. DS 682]|nr:hypothetical protein IL306_013984 [Fusarium sp. DS 682]